jgi:hypothetical protein
MPTISMTPLPPVLASLRLAFHRLRPEASAAGTRESAAETGENARIALEGAAQMEQEVERGWNMLWGWALDGKAEAAHSVRAEMLALATGAVETVETIRRLAAECGCDAAVLRDLDTVSKELARRRDYRAARWQTPEDLEDLAAESLVPADAELRTIQARLPFPQGWLEADVKPF